MGGSWDGVVCLLYYCSTAILAFTLTKLYDVGLRDQAFIFDWSFLIQLETCIFISKAIWSKSREIWLGNLWHMHVLDFN